ncbi:shikimate kinase [Corynebacterium sp. ES2794-CONJ1]|uniref:shikimate kinase n=1 Tax=unclassified Corynebacterium TaxID=2624378 RepID=UPI002168CD78|nr:MULTISPECIES: shikimate kinase [unclassified Corynebacterium]MCS4489255.1 shikimate kinase [Corynebacterium sp. ES2775-CONJ]MCS4491068.1 shikimate kinase [Corynebacterium sp. ES2715-CONJ3]MCS4531051.1 shikimate kinase [Corynebacterium sp. ES2730-CONJ]MCU9518418.1 shikimate kinase [Corynebacterium sp. ES2794-CONJ1]
MAPKIVLVGPPGAGKTTIARRLSSALNIAHIDSDELIEQRTGQRCRDFIEAKGIETFRAIEAEVIAEALQLNGVLSLGGGAIEEDATRKLLIDHPVAWIDVSIEEGDLRTRDTTARPLLDDMSYEELVKPRIPLYREVADIRIPTDTRPPQQVVADILSFMESYDAKDCQ